MRSCKWISNTFPLFKSYLKWNSGQYISFLTGSFGQSLYAFFKSKFIINFYSQKFFIERSWEFPIRNIQLINISVMEKKVRFICMWIHFHTIILKSQKKLPTALLISLITLHKKLSFPLRIYSVNVTKLKNFIFRAVLLSILNYPLHMLSFVQLTKLVFCTNRKRSQRKALKPSGPNMEPCGTPFSIFVQVLNIFFTFIYCFWWLK